MKNGQFDWLGANFARMKVVKTIVKQKMLKEKNRG
jgi:hypothetical protein